MTAPQLEEAKNELRATMRAVGITPKQLLALSPAIARYVAAAVRHDRAKHEHARSAREAWRREVREWMDDAQARVEAMHRGGAHGSR